MTTPVIADPAKWRSMQTWCDAYSLHLEALAEAHNSKQIRSTLADASKRTSSLARDTRSNQDMMAAANQRAIENQAKHWSIEEHRTLMEIWNGARKELLAASWDLKEEIQYCQDPKSPRRAIFWQGPPQPIHVPPPKDALSMPLAQASISIRFLRFVAEHATKFDPVTYTKQMLERQGINERNFDQHQDKLAIVNPWKAI